MSDISVSERRLSAALDRIDRLLEAGTARPAVAAPDDALQQRLEDLQAQNTRLAAENAALRAGHGAAADAAELDEAQARLASASEQAARLAAANDDLAAANRALIDAASGSGDADQAIRDAMSAEIEALHAARAAEIAQMGDIMIELERLLALRGDDAPPPERAAMPEVEGDSAGVPEIAEAGQGDDDASLDGDDQDDGDDDELAEAGQDAGLREGGN